MQATIKIKESELDYSFFKKLKTLFRGGEFEIGVNTQNEILKEQYRAKIDKAIDDIENKRNLIEFTGEEFEAMVAKLSTIPIQKNKNKMTNSFV